MALLRHANLLMLSALRHLEVLLFPIPQALLDRASRRARRDGSRARSSWERVSVSSRLPASAG